MIPVIYQRLSSRCGNAVMSILATTLTGYAPIYLEVSVLFSQYMNVSDFCCIMLLVYVSFLRQMLVDRFNEYLINTLKTFFWILYYLQSILHIG